MRAMADVKISTGEYFSSIKLSLEEYDRALRRQELDNLHNIAGLSSVERSYTLESHPVQKYVPQLREWLKEKTKPGMYLFGPAGTGKTGYAVSIVNEIILNGKFRCVPRYIKFIDYVRMTQEEKAIIRNRPGLLVVDEVIRLEGNGYKTKEMEQDLYDLTDLRLERNRMMTVFTSNYTPDEITESAQIRSRILIRCTPIELKKAIRK